MTRVLPDPGPARMSSGPSMCWAASRCWGLRLVRRSRAGEVATEALYQGGRGPMLSPGTHARTRGQPLSLPSYLRKVRKRPLCNAARSGCAPPPFPQAGCRGLRPRRGYSVSPCFQKRWRAGQVEQPPPPPQAPSLPPSAARRRRIASRLCPCDCNACNAIVV